MKIDWFYLNSLAEANVTRMEFMFTGAKFNGDLSKWNTSSVTDMSFMFAESQFNQPISLWNVSSVKTMEGMFKDSKFNQDISIQANEPWRVRKWDVSKVEDMDKMFFSSDFNSHKNQNRNLGYWDLSNKKTKLMFDDTKYSMENYIEDRKNYLQNIELEKEKITQKEIFELNKELNKDIELDTLEMEF